MADDTEIEVGLDLNSVDFVRDLNQAVSALKGALEGAQGLAESFKTAVTHTTQLNQQISSLKRELASLDKKSPEATAIRSKIQSTQQSLDIAQAGVPDNKVQSAARAAAKNDILSSRSADGRTLDQAQLQNFALQAAITAINTTTEQIAARLADATAKASERMIKTSQAHLEAQLNKAQFQATGNIQNFTGAGLARSYVTREIGDYTRNQRIQNRFGYSTDHLAQFNPSELGRILAQAEQVQANLRQDGKNDTYLNRLRYTSMLNQQRDEEKAQREQEAQEEKNRKYILGLKQRHFLSEQRAEEQAQSELARQEEANRKYLLGLRQRFFLSEQRAEEQAQREKEAAQTRADQYLLGLRQRFFLQEQKQEEGNAKYLQELKRRSMLQEQRDQEKAAREARVQADPAYAARVGTREMSFLSKTGLTTGEFESRTANLTLKERVGLYKQLVAEQEKLRVEQRKTAADQRLAQRPPFDPNAAATRSSQVRNAALNLNGGRDFLGFQARLAGNYAIIGGITAGFYGASRAIVEFDDTLAKFQAITQTSDTETESFRTTLLNLGNTTRFSVNELAQAAITIGQTGLSASETAKALQAVATLATASGSTIGEAVEVITSTLGAYNMEAGRSAEIANVLVGALNQTKLTMNQLQLGIQYAANIARDAGVSFTELTAVIGGIAQAGIKSGSTIGTGVRQLMQELISPSDKLKEVLKQLNISLADIDIRANGLTGVLENLRAKGFTSAEALRSLDLRAASAFSALSGQADRIKTLQQSLLLSNDASESAAKAQESLLATLTKTGNVMFALLDKSFSPFVEILKTAVEWTGNLVGTLNRLGPILPIIGTGLSGIAVALAGMKIGNLLGLGSMIGAIGGPAAAAAGIAIGLVTGAVIEFLSQMDTLEKRLDRVKGIRNELQSTQTTTETAITNLDQEVSKLLDRKERLNADPLLRQNAVIEAQKAFSDLGLNIKNTSIGIDELIDAMRKLKGELQQQLPNVFSQQLATILEQMRLERQKLIETASKNTRTVGTTGIDRRQFEAMAPDLAKKLAPVFDVLDNPTKLNPANARSDANSLFQLMGSIALPTQQRLQELQVKSLSGEDLTRNEKGERVRLESTAKILANLTEQLNQTIGGVQQLQSLALQAQQAELSNRASKLTASPEFQAYTARTEDLKAQYGDKARAILQNSAVGGVVQRERLQSLIKETQDTAAGILQQFDQYLAGLTDQGYKDDAIKQASAKLRDDLGGLSKGVTKEIEEITAMIKPDASREYQAQRRANQAEVERLMKKAANSRDPEKLNLIQSQIDDLMTQRRDIEKKLLELETPNPDQASPALRAAIKEKNDEIDTQTATYVQQLNEYRKRLTDQILQFQDRQIDDRKNSIEAEAAKLEKQLRDAKTTPEKAKDLIATINQLLDEAKRLALQQLDIQAQREINKAPDVVVPSLSATTGSVQRQIIDGLNQAGLSHLVPYALGTAQRESGFDPHAGNASGAKGLFAFMNNTRPGGVNTWGQYSSGDIYDVGEQINAFIKFTQDNMAAFKRAFGRDADDAEKYLLQQQGAGGGISLLKNPGALARDIVGVKAVTGNGGSADMTAAQFIEHVKGQYTSSAAKTAGLYTTPADTIRQETADRTRKAEEEDAQRRAANDKTATEIRLRKEAMRLRLDENDITQKLRAARKNTNDATDMGNAQDAAGRVIDTVKQLRDNALGQLDKDTKFIGSEPEDQALEREKVNARFRAQAEKEALENAKQLGDLAKKKYDKEVETLTALRDQQKLGVERGTVAQGELDATERKLEVAQRARDLDGEEASKRTEILEIEKEIKQIKEAGLGNEDQLIDLQSRLNALKGEELDLSKKNAAAREIQNRSPDFGKAVNTADTNFLKSRGLMDNTGKWVDDAVRFGKTWNEVLDSVGGNLDQFWENWASGSMKAGSAFKQFSQSVISDLLKMASKAVTNELFKLLLGGGDVLGGSKGSDSSSGGGLLGSLGSWLGSILGGGKALGGSIIRRAGGGPIYSGIPNRDSQLTLTMPGEYVVRKSAVDAVGRDTLDAINQMGSSVISQSQPNAPGTSANDNGKGIGSVNVWVVSADQVPPPGPRDIVAHVSDDIQRGGSIKQLIKQVSAGAI